MNWQDASEIVGGLVLTAKISKNSVTPNLFFPPYDEVVKYIKEGKTVEDIILEVGITPVQASLDAVKSVNGLSKQNWVKILETSAQEYDAGVKLEKFARKLQQGDKVDWAGITSISKRAQLGTGGDFVPLSEIESGEVPFKLTGTKFIDEHLGGFPEVGQVIIAAAPGTGKTTLLAGIAAAWAKKWAKENVAIFTLEMIRKELAMRFREVNKLPLEVEQRILVNDNPVTPEEVISKASTIENLGIVFIDFADLLIAGETNESSMAHIYRTFMLGAKALGCPIVLLSQLNRTYTGGIPRPNAIRYTGLAEALAWMILMLYNPANDYFASEDCEDILPVVEGRAYVLAWKVRGGFRKHVNDAPGAIQVQYKGDKGWNIEYPGKWFSLKKVS